jgi:5-formyltetrahydrofolate cyclo-ligase
VWTARANRPAVDRESAGGRLASYAADLLALARNQRPTVAAYAGVAEEPPTRPLLDALVAAGAHVLLPVVRSDDTGTLDWAPYEGWANLATGRWGLLQPTSPPSGSEAVDAADLVVVPALAIDRAGHRLGRGRGFYDRALANVDRARRVAVVYADEIIDAVPHEPHDEPVGWALTPEGLAKLG